MKEVIFRVYASTEDEFEIIKITSSGLIPAKVVDNLDLALYLNYEKLKGWKKFYDESRNL